MKIKEIVTRNVVKKWTKRLQDLEARYPSKTYTLSDIEQKTANKWLKKHFKICKYTPEQKKLDAKWLVGFKRTMPAGCWISFSETGIGCCVMVKCDACGETQQVTDYDSW